MNRLLLSLPLIAMLLVACGDNADTTNARPSSNQPPRALENDSGLATRLTLAMAAPSRPATDRALDATRRPVDVLEFMGIKAGMSVLDVNAAGGYYTELLAAAVGPSGKVYAQNDIQALEGRGGQIDHELTGRLAGNRLPNVVRLDADLANLELEQELDAAVLMLTLHDLYNFGGEAATIELLRRIREALKPGAVLGVVDHVGELDRSADARELHRIEEGMATRLLEAAGFTIEARSDVLRNPQDTHDQNVFHESVRRRTDRFVVRARA